MLNFRHDPFYYKTVGNEQLQLGIFHRSKSDLCMGIGSQIDSHPTVFIFVQYWTGNRLKLCLLAPTSKHPLLFSFS